MDSVIRTALVYDPLQFMYAAIHTYIFHMHIFAYVHVYINTYIYICNYTDIHMHICTHTRTCMYMNMHMYIYVYMCPYTYSRAYIHLHGLPGCPQSPSVATRPVPSLLRGFSAPVNLEWLGSGSDLDADTDIPTRNLKIILISVTYNPNKELKL